MVNAWISRHQNTRSVISNHLAGPHTIMVPRTKIPPQFHANHDPARAPVRLCANLPPPAQRCTTPPEPARQRALFTRCLTSWPVSSFVRRLPFTPYVVFISYVGSLYPPREGKASDRRHNFVARQPHALADSRHQRPWRCQPHMWHMWHPPPIIPTESGYNKTGARRQWYYTSLYFADLHPTGTGWCSKQSSTREASSKFSIS